MKQYPQYKIRKFIEPQQNKAYFYKELNVDIYLKIWYFYNTKLYIIINFLGYIFTNY